MMKIAELISGYEKFKDTKFKKYENKFLDLVKNGQHPKVLFIACSAVSYTHLTLPTKRIV